MIDASQIQMQILMLEAQKAGIEEQLRKLKEIRCPACKSSKQLGTIEAEEPDPEHAGGVILRWDPCEACNGTGYACGETLRY